jgi:acetyl/propionyl-CoA carboxylase alpha subunit
MPNLLVTVDGQTYEVELSLAARPGEPIMAHVGGAAVEVVLPTGPEGDWLVIDGRPYEFAVDPGLTWIKAYDGLHPIEVRDRNERVARPRSGDGRVKAPIPGLIVRALVAPGEAVSAGQPVVVLEAMKMENEIRAPFDGTVSSVAIQPGQTVIRGEVLVEIV